MKIKCGWCGHEGELANTQTCKNCNNYPGVWYVCKCGAQSNHLASCAFCGSQEKTKKVPIGYEEE